MLWNPKFWPENIDGIFFLPPKMEKWCVLHPSSTTFSKPAFFNDPFKGYTSSASKTKPGRDDWKAPQPGGLHWVRSWALERWTFEAWHFWNGRKSPGRRLLILAGGLKYFFFHPENWGRWSNLTIIFFKGGWNHQLEPHWFPLIRPVTKPLFLRVWILG